MPEPQVEHKPVEHKTGEHKTGEHETGEHETGAAMDWDEPKAKSRKEIAIGEELAKLSVIELEERVALLAAEIARIEATIAAKKRTTASAAALFGEG